MERYKAVHYEQDKFIQIRFSQQILPGTFEYTLNYQVKNKAGAGNNPVYRSRRKRG